MSGDRVTPPNSRSDIVECVLDSLGCELLVLHSVVSVVELGGTSLSG